MFANSLCAFASAKGHKGARGSTSVSESGMEGVISRAVSTVVQMLEDRGEAADGLRALGSEGIAAAVSAAGPDAVRLDTGARDILVFLRKPNTAEISRVAAATEPERLGDVMLISPEPFRKTQQAAAFASFGPHEAFALTELMMNVARHTLVPKHVLVPRERAGAIAAAFHTANMAQFPLIRASDAMAKYIRARPGDLVMVTRACPSVGTQVAYRFCVA